MSEIDDLKKEMRDLKIRIGELEEENNVLKSKEKPLETRPYRHPGVTGI